MDDAGFQLFERPRKRGRPLTYEEKWVVQHVFETFAKKKKEGGIIRIEEADPYSLTSKYTGVARSVVATISKSVRQTGSVPVSTSPGHRQQPTAIPLSTEGQIRECIFEQHRQGTICHAKHDVQEDALIEVSFLYFEKKKSRGDYHGHFYWKIFQKCFKEQLLPHLPPRCLIVLDRFLFPMVCRDAIVPIGRPHL